MWITGDQDSVNKIDTPSVPEEGSTNLITSYLSSPNCSPPIQSTEGGTIQSTSSTASPAHSVDVSGSPSTVHSTHGLQSIVFSSTLPMAYHNYTPSVSVSGSQAVSSVSSSASPISTELPKCIPHDEATELLTSNNVPKQQEGQNSSESQTLSNRIIRKRSLTGTKRKSESTSMDSNTFSDIKINTGRRSNTMSRKVPRRGKAHSNPVFSASTPDSSGSNLSGSLSTPASTPVDSRCGLQYTSIDDSVVSNGLKIRIRRDSAPVDLRSTRGKRIAKRREAYTFRIVESWCDTDAPGGEFSRRFKSEGSTTSPLFIPTNGSLRVGDIVWAKLAGYPYWPSRISAIWARTAHQLSQATLFPSSHEKENSSLAVLATPSDPNLAAGYTARVDWLAWDQCSYLSCAKLYPFKEAFAKLYNPRTRVKGYAEAVRLAKSFAENPERTQQVTYFEDSTLSPDENLQPVYSSHGSLPHNIENQFSSANISANPPSSIRSNTSSKEPRTGNITPFTVPSSQYEPDFLTVTPPSCVSAVNETCEQPIVSCDLSNCAQLPPLPQLDMSGLGDFVSHVPTFSEDEDDISDTITSQLRLDFG